MKIIVELQLSSPYKPTAEEIEEAFPEKSAKILLMHEMYKK